MQWLWAFGWLLGEEGGVWESLIAYSATSVKIVANSSPVACQSFTSGSTLQSVISASWPTTPGPSGNPGSKTRATSNCFNSWPKTMFLSIPSFFHHPRYWERGGGGGGGGGVGGLAWKSRMFSALW